MDRRPPAPGHPQHHPGKHRADLIEPCSTPYGLNFRPRHCAGADLTVSWCLHNHPGEAPFRVFKGWRR